LPTVLLDSLGGAQEAGYGVFAFGALVRGSCVGFATGVHAHRQVLPEQSPAGTDRDTN
jgi:hypothetical protein